MIKGILLIACLFFSLHANAQETDHNWNKLADGMTGALIKNFWGASFKEHPDRYFFNKMSQQADMATNDYWPQAHAMDVIVDAYLRTHDDKYLALFDQWWEGAPRFNFCKRKEDPWWNVFVDDMEKTVEEYTSSHLGHVKQWYKDHQQEDDLVISASPEFLIRSFCEKVNIRTCMASKVDMHTGRYEGENCHGEEKVRRFREVFPDGKIGEFYSDSYSDTPLARLAEKAFLVKGDRQLPWETF